MSLHPTSAQLALFASADLKAAERAWLAGHLRVCSPCRDEAAQFTRADSLLSEFDLEPSEEDLDFVRRSVVHRLAQAPPAVLSIWRWQSLAVVSAVLVLGALWIGHRSDAPLRLHQPSMASLPVLELPRLTLALAAHKPAARPRVRPTVGIRKLDLIARSDGTNLLKITTADPNVLILLPMGESQ